MATDNQDTEQWKRKYFDQIEDLETKETEWGKLESTLKHTIGRLSLAAEGQHATLDRHISDLRTAIKSNINRHRLDTIVDDISHVLSKLEDSSAAPNRLGLHTLEQLINGLKLPKSCDKAQKKLLKQLKNADDEQLTTFINESINLFKIALIQPAKNETPAEQKSGLLSRLFSSDKAETQSAALSPVEKLSQAKDQSLTTYKSCLIELMNKLDNPQSPSGKLTALKMSAKNASEKSELDKLSEQLSELLTDSSIATKDIPNLNTSTSDATLQPSIQELLIRLLEQLIVPADLQTEANEMKTRLEKEPQPADWKVLLKDVVILINSIRSRMQKEKYEFETFLQQVTNRLKTMDQFLQSESSNLKDAKTQGDEFDNHVTTHVDEIRLDIRNATELTSLKNNVNNKLDTITKHIESYRSFEIERREKSQQEVSIMHSKMLELESETENLKKVVIEKNKLAMFDVLTEIPNRLSYENKSEEEISRWKRFKEPLSLAIWDIDLFKLVNDTYGHKAGDKVLKTVAQLLNKRIRATDFLARYGGEEFVMLLPGTKQEDALPLVNNLRSEIENCGFHYQGQSVGITISCGVSEFYENDTLSSVFERADKALYEAKKNGRNQCVIAANISKGQI